MARPGTEPDDDRYAASIAYLDAHSNLGIVPGLERMRASMELLGEPQRSAPVIHVTGTNGKTSVVRMVTALLDASGLATGSYVSPHLVDPAERISLRGEPVEHALFAATLEYLKPVLAEIERRTGRHPSYFETGTILAFAIFSDEAVDAAVVEVGLGGTFDATNVADGDVAVITNISADHVDLLGADLAGIAKEKSGIIKAGAAVISGVTAPELAAVVTSRAAEVGAASVAVMGTDIVLERCEHAVGGIILDVSTPLGRYDDVFVATLGRHQSANAALAIAAAEAFFGRALDADLVRDVMAEVQTPGRLEVMRRHPTVVIDGAHNPAGAQATRLAVDEVFRPERLAVVLGVLADKDVDAIVAALCEGVDVVVATGATSDRAADPQTLAAAAAGLVDDVRIEPDVAAAIEVAADAVGAEGTVLVSGSLYLVGAAREYLRDY